MDQISKEEIDERIRKYDESRLGEVEHRLEGEICIHREHKEMKQCLINYVKKVGPTIGAT